MRIRGGRVRRGRIGIRRRTSSSDSVDTPITWDGCGAPRFLEGIAEVDLDNWPRGVRVTGRAEAQAAGEGLRAQLDAHTVHVAGGIETPAVEHGPGVPANAREDVRREFPLRPELRHLDVATAPLLRA